MTNAQIVAAVLLRPELASKPEFAEFKKLVNEVNATGDLDAEMVERLVAALPK